jgi:heat shock protein HtpX
LQTVSAISFPLVSLLVLAVAPRGVGLLQLALSRTREGAADLEAAELTGDPHGLALALIKLRRREQMLLRGRFPTAMPLRLLSLFRDHPATEQRIQPLLAMPQPRDFEAEEEETLELVGDYPARGPWGWRSTS